MILIGENIHIISKKVREALINRDESFVTELINTQSNMDYIDLNVGPAKGDLENILPWMSQIIDRQSNAGISFDTTNLTEMENGLKSTSKPTFINSTSLNEIKLQKTTDLALEYNSNLIALTMDNGIPKTADERVEIAFQIYEKATEKSLNPDKIFFDPLILPVCIEQSQSLEALNTIRMIKESLDVKTIVGLSNISNGCPQRSLLNSVYATLLYGAGLDAAIIDAKDTELVRILNMLTNQNPQSKIDKLLIDLSKTVENFGEIQDVNYDKNSIEQTQIIKAANILLNNEIYSHSFTQI